MRRGVGCDGRNMNMTNNIILSNVVKNSDLASLEA